MAEPLYVQEQRYLNPPFMGPDEWTKWENHPGEYRWIKDTLYQKLSEYVPWPSHLDNDPISISQKMVQAAFWGRKTGDTGYYQAVMARYGYLLDPASAK